MNAKFPFAMIVIKPVFAQYLVDQRLETEHFFGTEHDHQALYRRMDHSDRGLC